MDIISLDVDSLKLRSIPPKHDINESLKAMRISIECKERTARTRAKKDCFVKACSSSFHDNNDEDLKVVHVSPVPFSSILTLLNKESIEETPITLRSLSFLSSNEIGLAAI